MSECMMFPKDWEKFIEDYSFEDKEEVYTNGSMLIPVFRVEQMIEHYFGRGWIPVTERLPEDDLPKDSKSKQIKAQVAYKRNGVWVIRTNMRKKGQWHKKPDEWSWSVSDPITHWMPLPEPPKEEEK